jgi:outer membrane protein assembly factor BamB
MRVVTAVVVFATVAGCAATGMTPASPPPMSSTRPPGAAPPAVVGPGDWRYHHNNPRTGVAGQLAPLGSLRRAWQTRLDGAVYGQPLVIGDRVIAATEHNTVYALAAADGHVLWSASLGEPVRNSELPCGNIDPLGITGTAAYDQNSGLVFVETQGGPHTLAGVDLASGAVLLRRALPPPGVRSSPTSKRAALTVLDGWVYVTCGGLFDDCGNYLGSVLAAPTTGRAVDVDPAGGLRLRWKAAIPADGFPVVGGGAVWVTDTDHGILYALDPATGTPRRTDQRR